MIRIPSIGVALASAAVLAAFAPPSSISAQRVVGVDVGPPPVAVTRPWSCLTLSIAEHSIFQPAGASRACGDATPAAMSPAVRLGPRTLPRTAVPIVAPLPPTGLAATISNRTVVLVWMAPAGGDPPSSYVLEAGSASGSSDRANTDTGSSAPSLTATDVAPGTYFVRVRARNASGTSAPSNEIIVVVGGGCEAAPGAPSSLAATVSGGSVTLTWLAPTAGCAPTSYVIEAGSAPGLSNLASIATGNASTVFSASGVGSGTYYVRVRSANGAGVSGASNEIQFSIASCPGPPATPVGLIAQVSNTTVVLSWSAASGSPSSYVLEAGSAPGSSNIVASDTGSLATTMTADAVPAIYYVRIRARNACGVSAPSTEIVVVVSPPGTPCLYSVSPVAMLAGAEGGIFTVNVATASGCAWTAASNASFLAVTSAAAGSGPASITFTVQSHSGIGRGGTLTIGGRNITVTQVGLSGFASCVSSIIHCHALGCDAQTFSGAGGTSEVIVSAPSDCAWVAGGTAPWLAVYSTSPGNEPFGTGAGHFGFSVAPNSTDTSRTATIVAGGAVFTITQLAR